jgi:hypothetical protein
MSYIRQKIAVNKINNLALYFAMRNGFFPYGGFLRHCNMVHPALRNANFAMRE